MFVARPGAGVARGPGAPARCSGPSSGCSRRRRASSGPRLRQAIRLRATEVVDRPEAVDVALAEPGAAAQGPGVGARVVDLDPGPQARRPAAPKPKRAPPSAISIRPLRIRDRRGEHRPARELGGRRSRALRVRVPRRALEPQPQRLPVDLRAPPGRSSPGSEPASAGRRPGPARGARARASRRRRARRRDGSRCGPEGRRRAPWCATRRRDPWPSAVRRGTPSPAAPKLPASRRRLPITYACDLAPGGVVDVGEHGLDRSPGCVEAEEEADRVEAVAEVAQVGQQPDRPRRARRRSRRRPGRGPRRRAADRPGPRWSERRNQASAGRRADQPRSGSSASGQLGEVEVGHEDRVAERVLDRVEAPVADPALVERRGASRGQLQLGVRRLSRLEQPLAGAHARSSSRPRESPSASRRRSSGSGRRR